MSVMRVRTDELAAGARTPAALPPVAPGERLHLLGVEGAAPAAGHAPAAELAAAHVRVHGLGLHARAARRLPWCSAVARSGRGGFLIAHGHHRIHKRRCGFRACGQRCSSVGRASSARVPVRGRGPTAHGRRGFPWGSPRLVFWAAVHPRRCADPTASAAVQKMVRAEVVLARSRGIRRARHRSILLADSCGCVTRTTSLQRISARTGSRPGAPTRMDCGPEYEPRRTPRSPRPPCAVGPRPPPGCGPTRHDPRSNTVVHRHGSNLRLWIR